MQRYQHAQIHTLFHTSTNILLKYIMKDKYCTNVHPCTPLREETYQASGCAGYIFHQSFLSLFLHFLFVTFLVHFSVVHEKVFGETVSSFFMFSLLCSRYLFSSTLSPCRYDFCSFFFRPLDLFATQDTW